MTRTNAVPLHEGIYLMFGALVNVPIYVFILMLATSTKWQEVLNELGVLPYIIFNVVVALILCGATFFGAMAMILHREKGLDEKIPKSVEEKARESKFKPT